MPKIVLFVLSAFLILPSCKQRDSQSAQALDIGNFEKKLNNTPDRILLDVRTSPEYQQGHLANSIMIDIHSQDFTEQVNKLDRSKPVFVYCASGIRSEKAANILKDQGFREIYHMDGGLNEWVNANRPIVKD